MTQEETLRQALLPWWPRLKDCTASSQLTAGPDGWTLVLDDATQQAKLRVEFQARIPFSYVIRSPFVRHLLVPGIMNTADKSEAVALISAAVPSTYKINNMRQR